MSMYSKSYTFLARATTALTLGLSALLLAVALLGPQATAETVTWTPATTDVDGRPLPGDQLTQIRTGDCAGKTYMGWGNFPISITSVMVTFPWFKPCECAMARTIVPSFPPDRRFSPWMESPVCNGADAGVCH
jgi:hypothetical protein